MENATQSNNQPMQVNSLLKRSSKLILLKWFILLLVTIGSIAVIIIFKQPGMIHCTDGSQCGSGICEARLTDQQKSQLQTQIINGQVVENKIEGVSGKCLPEGATGCISEIKNSTVSSGLKCIM